MLDRHHTPGGETAAIPIPFDLVEHGLGRIARPHEIAVQ